MDIKTSVVAILNDKGKITGTGFVAGENLILTCTHVIEQATAGLNERVAIRFSDNSKAEAIVDQESFSPIYEKDVALLRVDALPQSVTPLPLAPAAGSAGHDFYAYGYATVTDVQGIGARGKIVDIVDNGRLVQLTSQEPDHGMSGGPVLDEQRGVVIGMVTKGKGLVGEDKSLRNIFTTFATSANVIFEVCRELKLTEICPYRSLDVFNEEDAPFFFGRDKLVQKLIDSLKREPRFLAVLGPSGSGKSSVVRAGLIPALRQGKVPGSQKWGIIAIRPANDPLGQLAIAGLPLLESGGLQQAVGDWLAAHPQYKRLVLFVDQFEEALVSGADEQRCQIFFAELAQVLESALEFSLVITLRDDYFSRIARSAALLAAWMGSGLVSIPNNLERQDLRAMLMEPARAVGLNFDEGLPETILDDAAEVDRSVNPTGQARNTILPLLEFALSQLWQNRQQGRLSFAAYRDLGRVTGGLAQWADQAYNELPFEQKALAQIILKRLVHLEKQTGPESETSPRSRQRLRLDELGNDPLIPGIIKHFVDRRLMSSSVQAGIEMVEYIHDAVAREWGMLNTWLEKDLEFLTWRQNLQEDCAAWQSHQRDEGDLLRGARLLEAKNWLATRGQELLPGEREFIQTSLAQLDFMHPGFLLGPVELETIHGQFQDSGLISKLQEADHRLILYSAVACGQGSPWLELLGRQWLEPLRRACLDEKLPLRVQLGAAACLGEQNDPSTFEILSEALSRSQKGQRQRFLADLLAQYLEHSSQKWSLSWEVRRAVFPSQARLRISAGKPERERMRKMAFAAALAAMCISYPVMIRDIMEPDLQDFPLTSLILLFFAVLGLACTYAFAEGVTRLSLITRGWPRILRALLLACLGTIIGALMFIGITGQKELWFTGSLTGLVLGLLPQPPGKLPGWLRVGLSLVVCLLVIVPAFALMPYERLTVASAALSAGVFGGLYTFFAAQPLPGRDPIIS